MQLAAFSRALQRGASTDQLKLLVDEWMQQAGLVASTDLDPKLYEILEGDPVPPPVPPPAAAEPDDDTAEQALGPEGAASAPVPAAPVRRHGAGAGGRWLAFVTILVTIAIAALVIWWSLKR